MDDHEQVIARDVAAAAAVHAARREVDGAIAALAASPLDEAAADRMREVLGSSRLRKARRALTRIQPRRPHLSVVTEVSRADRADTDPEDEDREPGEPVGVLAGGAAA
jgi:hypothetical protein